jgi:hypothetical protein
MIGWRVCDVVESFARNSDDVLRNCKVAHMLNALMVCLVEIMRFAPDEFFVHEGFNISRFDQDNAV